jgi:hypothetical protein
MLEAFYMQQFEHETVQEIKMHGVCVRSVN